MTQKRKRPSGPDKIAIVKRYLVKRVPISDLRDEYGPCGPACAASAGAFVGSGWAAGGGPATAS